MDIVVVLPPNSKFTSRRGEKIRKERKMPVTNKAEKEEKEKEQIERVREIIATGQQRDKEADDRRFEPKKK